MKDDVAIKRPATSVFDENGAAGALIQSRGTLTQSVVSVSYLLGMLLVFVATWRGTNPFQKSAS